MIWITGLSGAGKTTLCDVLYRRLKPRVPQLVKLDGDIIRATFSADLGYGEPDRYLQIKRIQRLAKMLADQGIEVLVSALYAHPDLLAWNRQNLPGYVEIYLRASQDLVGGRDSKGLYAKAAAGKLRNVVGIDIPYHEPQNPDVVLDAGTCTSPGTMADQLSAVIPGLA